MTPRRPSSLRLRFCLAGFAAAGAVAAGMAVSRHASPLPTSAVRPLSSPASHSPTMPERRTAAPFEPARKDADPRAAFLNLKAHASGEADRYRCGIFFRQWAERDFTAAFDCADRQPAGAWREEMLGWLALTVARVSPADAATLADHDMKPGPVRNEAVISILHQWAHRDLARAAAWADSFPQGPFRDRALDEVAGFMSDVPPVRSPN